MTPKDKKAWWWVPSLYFTQGLPYVLVVTVSVIMYKQLGLGNAEIGLYTSWLYLPWVLKPLWSPWVDLKGTKRRWFLWMQLLIALALFGVGLSVPTDAFLTATLACFWMAAFASATNDIASDGYYMIALSEKAVLFCRASKHFLSPGHDYRTGTYRNSGWFSGTASGRSGTGLVHYHGLHLLFNAPAHGGEFFCHPGL